MTGKIMALHRDGRKGIKKSKGNVLLWCVQELYSNRSCTSLQFGRRSAVEDGSGRKSFLRACMCVLLTLLIGAKSPAESRRTDMCAISILSVVEDANLKADE